MTRIQGLWLSWAMSSPRMCGTSWVCSRPFATSPLCQCGKPRRTGEPSGPGYSLRPVAMRQAVCRRNAESSRK